MRTDDEAAFEWFVAERSDDLLRTAVLLTRDRGHAEDLVQTALVKAYRRWSRIDGTDPYVRRVLVTNAASRWRLRGRQEIVSLPAHDPAGPDDAEAFAERDRMTEALATLPPRMGAVLVLRHAEDLSEATHPSPWCASSTRVAACGRGAGGAGQVTDPASVTAMRQVVADARLRRTLPERSGAGRAAVQHAADGGEHQAEHDLADTDT